ncbi:MAG: hypothetical protein HN352_11955 [Bacteroidetes bacterium]|nr:hypothetical protein [Bacteroidota bacterium]MBT4399651.1 hypothetical protein [Bacteroidota bacterium]MBT4409715.1 hypothetical protein [Bacteroidota bacterium]MBT7462504.1 hypothetical protein [Bacteroidota bacterium]
MIRYFGVVAFIFICQLSWGQSTIGQWNEHLPYGNATKVTKADDVIYCATRSGLFEYDTESFLIKEWSKVNGLNGVDIATMEYSDDHRMLIIAYANSNIDLLMDRSEVINIPDVKQKQIIGSKRINSIQIYQDEAFISCGFGIIVLNLIKGEISSTYYIGEEGEHLEVFETEIYHYDSIFAATAKGIRKAFVRHPNLENYIFWEDVAGLPHPNDSWNHMAYNDGLLFASHQSPTDYLDSIYTYNGHHWEPYTWAYKDIRKMEFCNDKLWTVSEFQLNQMQEDGKRLLHLNTYGFDYLRAQDALADENGVLWIADQLYGLMKTTDFENFAQIRPNGPWDRSSFDLAVAGNDLWVAGGGYDGAWNNVWIISGVSASINGTWKSFNPMTLDELKPVRDVVRLVVDPHNSSHVYAASWHSGILEFQDGEFIELHNDSNTNGALQSIIPGSPYIRIGGMAFDSDNNLWVTNSSVPNPVSVRKPDGSWQSFPYGIFLGEAFTGEIVITPGDIKWIQLPKGNGLFAFSNGNDLDDVSDDQYQKITVKTRWPNIKVINNIHAIAVDLEGRLWIGTSNGVGVFHAPSQVFNNPDNFFVSQPSVDLGDLYYHALLETETVTAIAVDGANRKWFGTRNSGVFLTNPDGTKLVRSFNTLNSPLLSDNIFSIAIDHQTGEVYFGTEAGIVSYRGDAIRDDKYDGPVYAFPNPVRPDYAGPITIRGLAAESIVKVTDINGNLVFETESLGGQAIWNGNDFTGNRVQSGVYMVFSASADAQRKSVTKILFVR